MSISDIIILLLPVLFPIAYWLYKQVERQLPENKQQMLDAFTNRVVKSIEQTTPGKSGLVKKNIAVTSIEAMFKDAKLDAPAQWVIELAIESCVYEMNRLIPTTSTLEVTPLPVPVAPTTGVT